MPTYQPFDWYQVPLYYDIIFDVDTGREADFLLAMLDTYGPAKSGSRKQVVFEPACGSGRLVAEMAHRGCTVIGLDASRPMLEFAGRRLTEERVRASLVEGRMESFRLSRPADLAHCLVSSFKHLLEEDAARSHLQCIAEALRPGGVYVLGIHLSDYESTARSRERWVAYRNGVHVTCNIQSWPPDRRKRIEAVRSRFIVEQDGTVHRYESHWDFRTYSGPQMRRLIKGVPSLEHVATYDFTYDLAKPIPFDGEQLDTVLVLRKK